MTLSAVPPISCELAADTTLSGRIFNIQRFSLNDGRGIRTLVFFKGCPHRCPWCANPESIAVQVQVVRREAKCLHCQPCPNDPDECPSGALERIGQDISLEALLRQLLKDDIFYRTSGGGVTLSGGEVLMQAPFAARLLCRLQALGIHTAIETAGDAPPSRVLSLAGYCDQVLFDLKIMDGAVARRLLNMNQPRVLANFGALVKGGVNVIPRVPLIPGFTMDDENIQRILAFLSPFGLTEIHLLPFHQLGAGKYDLLGRDYPLRRLEPPEEGAVDRLSAMMREAGYHVTVGG